jgi:hypothetical protein
MWGLPWKSIASDVQCPMLLVASTVDSVNGSAAARETDSGRKIPSMESVAKNLKVGQRWRARSAAKQAKQGWHISRVSHEVLPKVDDQRRSSALVIVE